MLKRVILWSTALFVISVVETLATDSTAAVLWDESIQGDLSGNGLVPTAFVLEAGTNSLLGSVQSGDLDYVTVKVPPGSEFTKLVLQDYSGIDFTAFIAVQAGPTFTAPAPIPPVASLLGYSHFGPNAPFGARVGDDLMYVLGTASGAMGFSAPLPSGDYAFWIQQTGSLTSYQFDFVVVPEPATGLIAGCGAAMLLVAVNRRKHST